MSHLHTKKMTRLKAEDKGEYSQTLLPLIDWLPFQGLERRLNLRGIFKSIVYTWLVEGISMFGLVMPNWNDWLIVYTWLVEGISMIGLVMQNWNDWLIVYTWLIEGMPIFGLVMPNWNDWLIFYTWLVEGMTMFGLVMPNWNDWLIVYTWLVAGMTMFGLVMPNKNDWVIVYLFKGHVTGGRNDNVWFGNSQMEWLTDCLPYQRPRDRWQEWQCLVWKCPSSADRIHGRPARPG